MVSRNAMEKLSERANLIWAQMQDAKARNDNNSRPLQTEEAAKTALVLPFIQALGYDVFDHSQVVPEFTADFGTRQGEKVDYAIMHGGEPAIIIECKKADDELRVERVSQLSRYFGTTSAHIGILTGGMEYKFFSDLNSENVMDREPFLEIDVRNLKERDLAELQRFAAGQFDLDNVREAARELLYTTGMRAYLEELYEQPDEAFVTLMARRVFTQGNLTSQRRDSFAPMVRRTFHSFVNDHINRHLGNAMVRQSAIESDALPVDENDQPAGPGVQDTEQRGGDIVTTVEEQEGYELVRGLVSDVVEASRVTMNDTQQYCGIILDGDSRKTICRFRFGARVKNLCFGDFGNETRYRLDTINDINNYADQLREAVRNYLTG